MRIGLKQYFSCKNMIKEEQLLGEIPLDKEIYKTTLQMAWPAAVERVLASLAGFIDSMMVSALGTGAIAAVGITQQPTFILLALIFSLNVGVTAMVSRRNGEGDLEGMQKCFNQAITIATLFALILSAFGIVFAEPILIFTGAATETLADAKVYFRIIASGMVFNALALNINAAQRGIGNTKIAMKTNITANIVNIIFNYLLIGGNLGFPALGIKGAAIATVFGNMIACGIALATVVRGKGILKLSFKRLRCFDKKTLKGLLGISSNAAAEQVVMRIGFLAYVKIVASLGTVSFATHQICMNILNLNFSFGEGMGMAASALVGKNLGAKRSDLSIIYGKTAQRIALVISAVMFIFYITQRDMLMHLFSSETEIIELGKTILIIIAITSPMQMSQVIISGSLRGAGDTRFVALSSFISILVVRPILTWVLCYHFAFGLIGAWFALLIDQALRLLLNVIRFSSGKWTKISI